MAAEGPLVCSSLCRSCFGRLPSTGSRVGLKSGKRCQVGAMPSAEIGESDSAGQGKALLGLLPWGPRAGLGHWPGVICWWRRRPWPWGLDVPGLTCSGSRVASFWDQACVQAQLDIL